MKPKSKQPALFLRHANWVQGRCKMCGIGLIPAEPYCSESCRRAAADRGEEVDESKALDLGPFSMWGSV